jgi:mRNA-degrading endonuclease toxin of MazEF toxin-antitoxin module
MSPLPTPRRGEVWWFDPDPVRGRELGYKVRPALVISTDAIALPRLGKVIVVPGTTRAHRNPLHVPFHHLLRGQPVTTYFCCEDVRAVDVAARLRGRMAPHPVPAGILAEVERILRLILGL